MRARIVVPTEDLHTFRQQGSELRECATLQGLGMPTTVRRESRVCPICELPLTVLRTSDGATIEYDVAEWTRLCRHPGVDSPLVCPRLEPLVKDWLDRP